MSDTAQPPLHLLELTVQDPRDGAGAFAVAVRTAIEARGARVVESTFASGFGRLYVIIEAAQADEIVASLGASGYGVEEVVRVRLVGDAPRAGAPAPSHVVEWDLPSTLTMDAYLKRKAEKTPLYAKVPEVQFLRTYVREDMVKCVCLYDAPDEDAVRRAREAVSAPIDRLSRVQAASDEE
jgi:Protein of unknown function (DUF4242)